MQASVKRFRSVAPQNKAILNKLTQQLKGEIKEYRVESIVSYLSELNTDCYTDYLLWKNNQNVEKTSNVNPTN